MPFTDGAHLQTSEATCVLERNLHEDGGVDATGRVHLDLRSTLTCAQLQWQHQVAPCRGECVAETTHSPMVPDLEMPTAGITELALRFPAGLVGRLHPLQPQRPSPNGEGILPRTGEGSVVPTVYITSQCGIADCLLCRHA